MTARLVNESFERMSPELKTKIANHIAKQLLAEIEKDSTAVRYGVEAFLRSKADETLEHLWSTNALGVVDKITERIQNAINSDELVSAIVGRVFGNDYRGFKVELGNFAAEVLIKKLRSASR